MNDPERYGVIEIDKLNNPIGLIEKPTNPTSNLAVTGLYFYDNSVLEIARSIKPSSRGELEITTVNQVYLIQQKLKVNILQRGSVWLDTGTFDSLFAAGNYVKIVEDRQGIKVSCLEEIAWRNGWIDENALIASALKYKGSPFSVYLSSLIQ